MHISLLNLYNFSNFLPFKNSKLYIWVLFSQTKMKEAMDVGRGIDGLYQAIKDANRTYRIRFPTSVARKGPINSVYEFLQGFVPDIRGFDLSDPESASGLEEKLKSLRGEKAEYAKRTLDISKRAILNMVEAELGSKKSYGFLQTVLGTLGVFDSQEQMGYMNTISVYLKEDQKGKVMYHVLGSIQRLLTLYEDSVNLGEDKNVLQYKFRNTLNALLVAGNTVQMQYYQEDIKEKEIGPLIRKHTKEILKRHFNGY